MEEKLDSNNVELASVSATDGMYAYMYTYAHMLIFCQVCNILFLLDVHMHMLCMLLYFMYTIGKFRIFGKDDLQAVIDSLDPAAM